MACPPTTASNACHARRLPSSTSVPIVASVERSAISNIDASILRLAVLIFLNEEQLKFLLLSISDKCTFPNYPS